ncbi:MAG: hypothetical protein Q9167_002418 [Letrouitia subvulpina]
MSKLLVVLGATGLQGSSVVNAILRRNPEYRIRGITRDANSDASQALAKKGVEMVSADRYDQDGLVAAFKAWRTLEVSTHRVLSLLFQGASAIFAMTDFWVPFITALGSQNPPDPTSACEIAKEDEMRQGRVAVDAALTCLDTLEHFIFSSLPNDVQVSNGKYRMPHFAAKVITMHYIQSLSERKASGEKRLHDITSGVIVSYYMENWLKHPYLWPQKTGDGTYVIRTSYPADVPLEMTATGDIGIYISAILNPHVPRPTAPVLALSESCTMRQMAASFSKATGKSITYEQTSVEELGRENRGFVPMMGEMYGYFEEFGLCGDMKIVNGKELGIGSEEVARFDSFVGEQDWGFWFKK